jgi:uncharacterized cupredoxin-like copper-binding protein
MSRSPRGRTPDVLKLPLPEADALCVLPFTPWRRAHGGLIALALLTAACSSSSAPADRATSQGGESLRVKVSDFKIVAPKTLPSGTVALRVHNSGPDMHELLLVRANGRALPLRKDDLTIDEDAIESRTVSELEDAHPDSDRTWKITLRPGTYQIVCNMAGHYLGGMHTRLVVR